MFHPHSNLNSHMKMLDYFCINFSHICDINNGENNINNIINWSDTEYTIYGRHI